MCNLKTFLHFSHGLNHLHGLKAHLWFSITEDLWKEVGDVGALDLLQTHVDRPCGKDTALTFVYIFADAVRDNEHLLKPHC